MHLNLGDPILVDVEALRRLKTGTAIDLARAPRKGSGKDAAKDLGKDTADAITLETADPLAAIIALGRRKTRR